MIRPQFSRGLPAGAMATTQLFVELLVIGIGAAAAFAFAAASVFGWKIWPLPFETNAITGGMLVAASYVAGIIADRLAYQLFSPMEKVRRKRVFARDARPTPKEQELHISRRSRGLRLQIAYNRSRFRICRASAVNFAVLAVAIPAWGARQDVFGWPEMAAGFVLPGLLAGAAYAVAVMLSTDHFINVRDSYLLLVAESGAARDQVSPEEDPAAR